MSQMCPECSRDNPDTAFACAYCSEQLRGLLGSNTLLNNRYRVLRVLGCGGMGAVYLAGDTRIGGRQVAIKENLDPAAQAQFQAEIDVMTRLRHTGLPGISDQFVGPNGRQYLVMDFIAGDDLEKVIVQRGPLPEAQVKTLALDLLEILAYLHANGVIHRDIKPANIKLTPAGKPILVDFGIAKQWAQGTKTQSWARGFGSPGFASPEHYGGRTDARSDLYSLGAVMYYLLTAQVPPEAPRLAAGAPLTPPRQLRPGLSPETQRIIFRAVAPAPDQRYQSAAEMRLAVAPSAQTPAPPFVPGTSQSRSQPRPQPQASRSTVFAVIGACLIGVIALLFAMQGGGPAPTPTPVVIVQRHTATSSVTVRVVPASDKITPTPAPARPSDAATSPRPTSTPMPSRTPTLIPTATLSPTPRPPTYTFTPTRIPPTSTPRPSSTPTPRPAQAIASNVSGFGGNQGANGWSYQVEQGRNSGRFVDFPSFSGYGSPSRSCWQTSQEGHVRICQEGEVHPGVTGRIAYRWRSDVGRSARVVVHAHKMDTSCGDGVWIGVYRVPQGKAPEKIGEFSIGGTEYRDRPANVYTYNTSLDAGGSVMVMVDIRGDSGCDLTRMYVDIY